MSARQVETAERRDVFSPEALVELRSKIGVPLRREEQYNEEATRDTIRHFAYGYGDRNPLYCDVQYGKETRYGSIIAPPTFLFTTLSHIGPSQMGLAGAHALFRSDDIEWFDVLRVGDRITSEHSLFDLKQVRSSFATRAFDQTSAAVFRDQRGEIWARELKTDRRFERSPSKKRDKYDKLTRHTYSPEEIEAIQADYDKEELRGANPRYWEDVKVDDGLPRIVKGPLTTTDIVVYKMGQGWNPFSRAHGIRLEYERRHPTTALPNQWGIPDCPERVHWEDDYAQKIGVPFAFDFGHQRITWMANIVTNWMSDDGFLRKLYVEIRMPNFVGDTTWVRGKVTGKYVENGAHMVECQLAAENQRGHRTAQAVAKVILPSREHGAVALPIKPGDLKPFEPGEWRI